jgi:hypothetical protein
LPGGENDAHCSQKAVQADGHLGNADVDLPSFPRLCMQWSDRPAIACLEATASLCDNIALTLPMVTARVQEV